MDELDLVVGLRPAEPLPSPSDLAVPRRVLTATLAAPARGSRPGRVGHGGLPRAWRSATAVTAAAAIGIAIAFAMSGGTSSPDHVRTRGHDHSVAAALTAVQFLSAAATATRHAQAGPPPYPDQYVYSENLTVGSGWTKEWLSADGSRAGLSLGQGSGLSAALVEPACTTAEAESTGCFLSAGYLPGLPASGDEVLPYLAKLGLAAASPPAGQHTPGWLDNDTGKAVAQLMSTTYLAAGQQSALFQLLAHTPGFRLIANAADAFGRRGVGIYWSYQGSAAMIVFSRATYRYLGFGAWPTSLQSINPSGLVAAPDGSALLAMHVVDAEPQAPRSTAAAALLRAAKLWATRQHHHRPWTIAEALAAYLSHVRHMSPAQIRAVLVKVLGHAAAVR